MNSQHYFKKLEKFAVCAFQAEKGCIEVELKSESCGIYHYVFYGSAKIGRPFQSEHNIVKKGDFFNMKDYLYQPRIYEALEGVYVWGFNTFPNQNWDARLLTDETLTVEGNNILICLDGKPIVNDKSLRRFDYADLSSDKTYDIKLNDGVLALFTECSV